MGARYADDINRKWREILTHGGFATAREDYYLAHDIYARGLLRNICAKTARPTAFVRNITSRIAGLTQRNLLLRSNFRRFNFVRLRGTYE